VLLDLINPLGLGLAVSLGSLLLFALPWGVAFYRMRSAFGGLASPVLSVVAGVVAAVTTTTLTLVLLLPPVSLVDTPSSTAYYARMADVMQLLSWVTSAGAFGAFACGALIIWSREQCLSPWRMTFVVLTASTATSLIALAVMFNARCNEYELRSLGIGIDDPRRWVSLELVILYFLMGATGILVIVSCVLTIRGTPHIRARWGQWLDRALENLGYVSWSQMPFSATMLPRPPAHWLQDRGDSSTETSEHRPGIDEDETA
jgi:hypothetical protein